MLIIYRRTPCLLRSTIFANRNFSVETNTLKNNEDQLKSSTINLLTSELKSARVDINSKVDLFSTQMKTEIVNIKREMKSELDISKKEINDEIDKIKVENLSITKDLGKVKFYSMGLFYLLFGGIVVIFFSALYVGSTVQFIKK